MALPKTYRAVARLGWPSTPATARAGSSRPGACHDELDLPTGDLMQRPPAYSAVKVGGERAYELARRGRRSRRAARGNRPPCRAARADGRPRRLLEIECSSGTYVRSLVADLGDAYCEELERTAIGPFRLEDADPERVVPLSEALRFLPERKLDEAEARRRPRPAAPPTPPGRRRSGSPAATSLVAIGEPRGRGTAPRRSVPPR